MLLIKIGYSTRSGRDGYTMVMADSFEEGANVFRDNWPGDFDIDILAIWDCHESWSIES